MLSGRYDGFTQFTVNENQQLCCGMEPVCCCDIAGVITNDRM